MIGSARRGRSRPETQGEYQIGELYALLDRRIVARFLDVNAELNCVEQ
jgi:hypothetical protein